ncbi:MAG: hypothetical protein ACLR23_04730 [Clostridia bacterium]
MGEEGTGIFSQSETEDTSAATPLTHEYETQELYARRDENRIYGVVYIPQDAGEKMPTVIFSHGFGGIIRSERNMPKHLPQKDMWCIALISAVVVRAAEVMAPLWKCLFLRNRQI